MPSRRSEQGLAAAAVVVVLILIAVVLVLGRGFFRPTEVLSQRARTETNLRRITESLIQYASLNQRLPCPARGDLDTGDAAPDTPTTDCTASDGTVPWRTLALGREAALDGWGRKISYRVFRGTTGLTQARGISMIDCNSNAAAKDSVELATGKCKSTRVTTPGSFFENKGLSLQGDSGSPVPGYAYILISHGESGAGAFPAEGGGQLLPPVTTALEWRNTQAGPLLGAVFDNRTRSAPSIAVTDTAYFDDIVLASSITDVVNAARLVAKDWGPPTTVGSSTFDTATATAAIQAAGGAVDYNTGQTSLDFGSFRVTAYGDTVRRVGFDIGTGSGIGAIGSGANSSQYVTLNRESNEGLTFVFDAPGRYLGITLARFGDAFGELERVSFDFVIGGSTVRVTKMSCRSGNGRVNFTVTPGADFTEVSIEPRLTQFFNYYSTFVVADIALCPSTNPSCRATGSIPGEDCP